MSIPDRYYQKGLPCPEQRFDLETHNLVQGKASEVDRLEKGRQNEF